jgi:hypothetical protein
MGFVNRSQKRRDHSAFGASTVGALTWSYGAGTAH